MEDYYYFVLIYIKAVASKLPCHVLINRFRIEESSEVGRADTRQKHIMLPELILLLFFFFFKTLVRDSMILITLIMLTSICSTVGHAIAGRMHCAPATHLDSSCLSSALDAVSLGLHASLITLIAFVKPCFSQSHSTLSAL